VWPENQEERGPVRVKAEEIKASQAPEIPHVQVRSMTVAVETEDHRRNPRNFGLFLLCLPESSAKWPFMITIQDF
jgi:hypothetical protein